MQPLWSPSPQRIQSTEMTRFMRVIADKYGIAAGDYDALHRFSVDQREAFWREIWSFCTIVGDRGDRTLINDTMPGAQFFPDAQLNFAENLLAHATQNPEQEAIVFWGEDKVKRRMTGGELVAMVSRLQQVFLAQGIGKGDRVAGMMPNMPETVAAMLATASLGAVWSSCSPDFGVRGVLDRFGQIEPKILLACDGYYYAGKTLNIGTKLAEIVGEMPSVQSVLVVDYIGAATEVAGAVPNGVAFNDALASYDAQAVDYLRLPMDHPLYIMFSSGTTGVPKCIVHCAGGVLIQQLKEHALHADNTAGDRVFYFTTCGWMMWNWLVAALGIGATLMLYDGSPFHPDGNILFDYADAEGFTFFGTSAKFIDSVKKAGLEPIATHKLAALKSMASTGSPLSNESFAFVYAGIKSDIHLASISGGTDILSCFVLGNPNAPVYHGEIQCPGLGMAVDVWNDTGEPVHCEKGELVCTKAFPSMPIMFWNDPDGSRYRAAYFDRFEGVWCHGDFAEWTEQGGMIIHGRSDATLNPGGVRIGTAEIYAVVEQMPEIIEALAIGQSWEDDVRIVLFVRLAEGATFDDDLVQRVRKQIREGASPRHMPARVVPVADIPRTKSGKITELAVRDVVHGRAVKNVEALANPEALALFEDIEALKS